MSPNKIISLLEELGEYAITLRKVYLQEVENQVFPSELAVIRGVIAYELQEMIDKYK